jgi:hypothetical protein
MEKAIEALRSKSMGLKKASSVFGVPRTTLQRRYKSNGDNKQASEKLGSKDNVFNPLVPEFSKFHSIV